jgi:hypothetical protein
MSVAPSPGFSPRNIERYSIFCSSPFAVVRA